MQSHPKRFFEGISLLQDTTEISLFTYFDIHFLQHQNRMKAKSLTTHGSISSLMHIWSHLSE